MVERLKPIPFIDHLPKPARYLCGAAGFAMIAACGQGTPPKKESPSPINTQTVADSLLGMPFPDDKDMNIQQGFLDDDGVIHSGIDYIKGRIDASPWQPFRVLAAADGQACLNPPKREGNVVFIQHIISGVTFHTYYGHLEDGSSEAIPECSSGKLKPVKKGEKIGNAGSTGTQWLHLHFQVNDFQGNPVDPYGIDGRRDKYPDPNFSNGKACGPKALLARCYQKGGVVIGAPGQPNRTQEDKIIAATIEPTKPPEIKPTVVTDAGPLATFTETNTPLGNQAEKEAFNKWLSLMKNSSQKGGDLGDWEIHALPSTDRNIIKLQYSARTQGVIASGGRLSGRITYYTSGLAEVTNVEVSAPNPDSITPADRASKIQFRGSLRITFAKRFKYSQSTLREPQLPPGKFTDFKNEFRDFKVILQDGRWNVQMLKRPLNPSSAPIDLGTILTCPGNAPECAHP